MLEVETAQLVSWTKYQQILFLAQHHHHESLKQSLNLEFLGREVKMKSINKPMSAAIQAFELMVKRDLTKKPEDDPRWIEMYHIYRQTLDAYNRAESLEYFVGQMKLQVLQTLKSAKANLEVISAQYGVEFPQEDDSNE